MTPKNEKLVLFFDDSGTRSLADQPARRADAMDWFAFGGILVKGENVATISTAHEQFCATHGIDYPLHSTNIRGHRRNFRWLRHSEERSTAFIDSLTRFITSQPMIVTAAVIHRPNYFARYRDVHEGSLWKVDKTAFCILVERAAKFARLQGRKLEVFFERSGPKEDGAIIEYMRDMKRKGLPFNKERMATYMPMSEIELRSIVLGDPIPANKTVPLIQLADLTLYPICKYGFEKDYQPYLDMVEAKMLVDQHVPPELINEIGIKYSCFQ